MLRGPSYREFVREVVVRTGAKSYLEIGVHNGSTLAVIDCAAIGVDPQFVFDRNPMGKKPTLHLYQMGSDDFFRAHDPRAIFGRPVDVAFLDGLHLFEYLLRDFINTERVCGPESVILLDDCLPANLEMTEREHRPQLRKDQGIAGWWTGDVWKVVHVLREHRPDLRIVPVDVFPTGSMVITGLDPASTRLQDAYSEIVERYAAMVMDDPMFETHWRVNAPRPASDVAADFSPRP
jgi:hypothetical protein